MRTHERQSFGRQADGTCLGGLALICFLAAAELSPISAAPPQAPSPAVELKDLLNRGEIGPAIELGRTLLPVCTDDPAFREQFGRAYFLLAEAYGREHRPPELAERAQREAIGHLRAARDLSPPPPPPHLYLGIAALHHNLGETAQSVRVATEGIAVHPADVPLHRMRAKSQGSLGAWEKAITDWDVVLRAEPADIPGAIARAEALDQLGRPCDAAEQLREFCVTSGNPRIEKDWRVHYAIARSLVYCRRYAEAVEPFDRAVEYAPERGVIAIERAENLYRVGRIEETVVVLDQWLAKIDALDRVQQVQALYRRGAIANASGERALARVWFEKVLALDPTHEGALQGLGALLRITGDTERAKEILERFRRLAPIALDIRIAKQMIARQPDDPRRRLDLIELLIQIPDPPSVRLELEEFARRFPRHPGLPELRRRLGALEAEVGPPKKRPAGEGR